MGDKNEETAKFVAQLATQIYVVQLQSAIALLLKTGETATTPEEMLQESVETAVNICQESAKRFGIAFEVAE